MRKLFFTLALILSIGVYANAGNVSKYFVDNNAVDVLFESATEIDSNVLYLNSVMGNLENTKVAEANEAVIATIICYFVGGFGIHRHYLGTKDNMWLTYTLSCCGIFGVVPFIDFWVLLIDGVIRGNVGPYKNNDKFFMWAK